MIPRIDVKNDLKELIKATGENVKIGAEANVYCKEFLIKAINSEKFSTIYYQIKMKGIFDIAKIPAGGNKLIVNRNITLRCLDLFNILNNN